MKQFLLRLVILAGISFLPTVSNAQLREKAEELLSTTLGNDPEEPVTPTDTLSLDEQHRKDSIKMQELALQLQEMKLNEILLKDELESTKNSNATADSLKRSEQRYRRLPKKVRATKPYRFPSGTDSRRTCSRGGGYLISPLRQARRPHPG